VSCSARNALLLPRGAAPPLHRGYCEEHAVRYTPVHFTPIVWNTPGRGALLVKYHFRIIRLGKSDSQQGKYKSTRGRGGEFAARGQAAEAESRTRGVIHGARQRGRVATRRDVDAEQPSGGELGVLEGDKGREPAVS